MFFALESIDSPPDFMFGVVIELKLAKVECYGIFGVIIAIGLAPVF